MGKGSNVEMQRFRKKSAAIEQERLAGSRGYTLEEVKDFYSEAAENAISALDEQTICKLVEA